MTESYPMYMSNGPKIVCGKTVVRYRAVLVNES